MNKRKSGDGIQRGGKQPRFGGKVPRAPQSESEEDDFESVTTPTHDRTRGRERRRVTPPSAAPS